MRTLTIFSLVLAAMLFIQCDETKKVIDVAGTVQLSGEYTVSEIGDNDLGTIPLTFSLAALDKSISGNSSCNSFFGNYTLDLYVLSFGTFSITEKYCDESIMDVERAYMEALANTGSYSLQENVLVLYSKMNRSVVLKANKKPVQGN